MIPELAALGMFILACSAELAHARRCRRVARLAFGPKSRPATWARFAPFLRIGALTALCWGMCTLLLIDPRIHEGEDSETAKASKEPVQHLLVMLDVSPSMRLKDAGPTGKQSRMERVADLMTSLFSRMTVRGYRTSVVAVYNGAKPVVVDTQDMNVIRNIMGDLPMHFAFRPGQTDLFSGLEEVVKIAHPWDPKSTTLLICTDGDTIPATGMPSMPASIQNVFVVGVGDPRVGSFIDGHQSRQDTSTLRQLAVRLHGTYHDGNKKHIPTDLVHRIGNLKGHSHVEQLTQREYAILAVALGGFLYALLPMLLHLAGTAWKPGVIHRGKRKRSGEILCENP